MTTGRGKEEERRRKEEEKNKELRRLETGESGEVTDLTVSDEEIKLTVGPSEENPE